MRWDDLRPRIVSGLVLAPLALACVWVGYPVWTLLVAALAVGLCIEWSQLCGLPGRGGVTVVASAGLAAAVAIAADGLPVIGLLLVAAVAATFLMGMRRPFLAWGLPYIGSAAVALIWLRDDPSAGRANLLFVVTVVWASDIGGYVVGRLVGGRRLAPSISPSKTWAGALGGLGAAIAVGGVAAVLTQGSPAPRAIVVAAGLGLVAQVGDLLESVVKRRFGVKDSGSLIPGHGGLLDRLDGLLAAGPAAALLLAFSAGRGVLLWR